MNEREAMAILVAATLDNYMQREAALSHAGSALNVVADPYACVKMLGKRGVAAVRQALAMREEIFEQISEMNVYLLVRGEAGYPERLEQIPRPPHLLYVQGNQDLDAALPIAIVGTRNPSDYGVRHTTEIAEDLAGVGACIVSGLALGIDAIAHEGALKARGKTIAVLGSGLDRFYPRENIELRDRLLMNGGSIVTEYPMGSEPKGYHFLLRNRIIAGLSAGVLVTQGLARSGALRTALDAADYGREVFALPGSVDDPCSQTPHSLISDGAHLAACAADILNVLAPELAAKLPMHTAEREMRRPQTRQEEKRSMHAPASETKAAGKAATKPIPQGLGEEERCVLEALAQGEMDFDTLCERTNLDATALSTALISLEMDGLIDALAGLRYARSE